MDDVFEQSVRRDGDWTHVNSDQLVVGDIICVESDKRVNADCIILESSDRLYCNEAMMTGEPDDLFKRPAFAANIHECPDPFLRSGTFCVSGKSTAMVLAVGINTEMG